jgi:hypothetical protein
MHIHENQLFSENCMSNLPITKWLDGNKNNERRMRAIPGVDDPGKVDLQELDRHETLVNGSRLTCAFGQSKHEHSRKLYASWPD